MTTAWRVFAGTAVFFAAIGLLYGLTGGEAAGATMLAAALALGALIGGYLFLVARRFPAGPEDRDDAAPSDGPEEIGWFPSASIWPSVVAAGAVVAATGLAVGWWLSIAGGLLLAGGVAGYALESRRAA